ncbi:MAG: hypothetical protein JWR19_1912 [Pedosphaera sp.]|nr:hypothetical protein [Pedosphaera sp.]
MNNLRTLAFTLVAYLALTSALWAGGSGLNVVVVVNQNSSNSVQLGNYYCEQRQVPPQNVLRVNWPGDNVLWTNTDFNSVLFNPLMAMLASRQLTNQIDYIVLSMDFPYRVAAASSEENSTTSTLFYGFKPDPNPPCSLASGSTSAYAGSEGIFRSTPPISASSNSFLVTMITASNLALAKQIIDHGVISDHTFPTQTVLLGKSGDPARDVRYSEFDNTVFDTRLRGNYSVLRTNIFDPPFIAGILGYENGSYSANLSPNAFIPGAMADNLTSFGGQIFQGTAGQTTLLSFLAVGASGSYGTVTEPCNYLVKFPSSENFFYQARGFSLAECYYQSVINPYQGMVAGEPLAAPFAQSASGFWNTLTSNSVLAATTNLYLQFTASDPQHPVQQIDLFLDGTWLQTVTNLPPHQNDILKVILNGQTATYTVPASATIKSVASGLASVLNANPYKLSTKVSAILHGDRIELQSTDTTKTGAQLSLSVSSTNSSGSLSTFVSASRTNFLDSIASGIKTIQISGTPIVGSSLQLTVTKTNGAVVTLAITNNSSTITLPQFTQQLLDLINNSPSLQTIDGLTGEDLGQATLTAYEFHLIARGQGYAAAQIQTAVSSTGLAVTPLSATTLTDNLTDLEPRNHLYITAGTTNLSVTSPLNTASLPDGYHELAAVAYEGSHVRTQTRATQIVLVQNTALSATFTTLLGGPNTALEATLQFGVVANTNIISKIELFSTGGSLGATTNQSSSTFSIAATNLDLGLHPFYALVTATNGQSYRTETKWIRLVGLESPVTLQIGAPPPTLVWPATAGRSYDILTATNVTDVFQVHDTLIPTNSLAQWVETNANPAQQFYRVRVSP